LADAAGDDLRVTAISRNAAELSIGRRRHADVARRADIEIEPVVRAYGQELPAVGLVFWQIAVDDGRLRRAVELVLDIVDFGGFDDLGERCLMDASSRHEGDVASAAATTYSQIKTFGSDAFACRSRL
jgi:hypothetical protein